LTTLSENVKVLKHTVNHENRTLFWEL